MKRTILKKDIGKYIVVKWLDPRRGDRESLKDFLVKPFEVIITTGKVVYVRKEYFILSQEECPNDFEEDLLGIWQIMISEVRYLEDIVPSTTRKHRKRVANPNRK